MTHDIHTPDAWLIIKMLNKITGEVTYKVFAQWYGGYTYGESWKLNSGIVGVNLVDEFYEFKGYSGSVYRCHQNAYRTTGYGRSVLTELLSTAESITHMEISVMEETNWLDIQYE